MCLTGGFALRFSVVSLLMGLPRPLHPLSNACMEDSAVSDFSLIWFLILSGLDRPALVCYFNLIHQPFAAQGCSFISLTWWNKTGLIRLVSKARPARSCVCRAEMINSFPLCQTECRSWAKRSAAGQELLGRKGASAGCEQCDAMRWELLMHWINTLSCCWQDSLDPFITSSAING